MRIIHVQKIAGIAGSENYLLKLFPKLKENNIESEFLALINSKQSNGHNDFLEKLQDIGVKTYVIDIASYKMFLAPLQICKVVKQSNPDLINSHLIHADFFIALTKRFFKLPKQVSMKHGFDEQYQAKYGFAFVPKGAKLYTLIGKFAEKKIYRSVAISQSLMNLFIRFGISNKANIEPIPYGFDFEEIKGSTTSKSDKIQIAIVGRLVPVKGHKYVLEVAKKLAVEGYDFDLNIVGDGVLFEELEQKISEYNLQDQVHLKGYDPNARKFMKEADIVLISSISEGFGIVALEAFYEKKAVVSFDVPAINEYITHGVNGLLAKPFDVEEYKNHVVDLIKNEQERIAFGLEGFKTWERYYSAKICLDRTVNFYKNCVIKKDKKVFVFALYPQDLSPSQRFRIEQYFAKLFYRGFDIKYHTFFKTSDLRTIQPTFSNIRLISILPFRFVQLMLKLNHIAQHDLVFIHRELSPFYSSLCVSLISKKANLIYDFDDALFLKPSKSLRTNLGLKNNYTKLLNTCDRVIGGNHYLLSKVKTTNKRLIPTTVDTENSHVIRRIGHNTKNSIGWTGTHSNVHYLQMLVPVFEELEKRKFDFTVEVICNVKPEFHIPNMVYKSWNRESEIDDLRTFDIGVMPLVDDDWSKGKCGLKILQYMSLGIITIASPVGVNLNIIDHGKNGFLATQLSEYVQLITALFKGEYDLDQIRKNALATVNQEYSVHANTEKYVEALSFSPNK